MSAQTQENMLQLLLLIVAIGPIIVELVRKGLKANLWYIGFLVIVAISIGRLGCNKVKRDGADKKASEDKINNLYKTVNDIAEAKRNDSVMSVEKSIKQKEFETRLFNEFHILKDSNNSPKVVNKTTNIKHADNVNIY